VNDRVRDGADHPRRGAHGTAGRCRLSPAAAAFLLIGLCVALPEAPRIAHGSAAASGVSGQELSVDAWVVERADDPSARLRYRLYQAARRDRLPLPVIEGVIAIFSADVDLHRPAQPGDAFEVLYAAPGEPAAGAILYAALTIGGMTKRAYRFAGGDGAVGYYDEHARSARKTLVRKPLAVDRGVPRADFGYHWHPILAYGKFHPGVDWEAPEGTPIEAAGDGTVAAAASVPDYGHYLRLRHAGGYETGYARLSAFAGGIAPGTEVIKGQVIGHVGTAAGTAAFLHYEVLVNGRFVDPMRIVLPRARALEGAPLAAFARERDRLDAIPRDRHDLIGPAPP